MPNQRASRQIGANLRARRGPRGARPRALPRAGIGAQCPSRRDRIRGSRRVTATDETRIIARFFTATETHRQRVRWLERRALGELGQACKTRCREPLQSLERVVEGGRRSVAQRDARWVSTPSAAEVAAATMGLARLMHRPNGAILTIGLWSMMVAAGWLLVITRLVGKIVSGLGVTPKLQANIAP